MNHVLPEDVTKLIFYGNFCKKTSTYKEVSVLQFATGEDDTKALTLGITSRNSEKKVSDVLFVLSTDRGTQRQIQPAKKSHVITHARYSVTTGSNDRYETSTSIAYKLSSCECFPPLCQRRKERKGRRCELQAVRTSTGRSVQRKTAHVPRSNILSKLRIFSGERKECWRGCVRKAGMIISLVISVLLSTCPRGITRISQDGFSWNFICNDFYLNLLM
jgi:hypothetical protein